MINAKLPQLNSYSDVEYMRKAFMLELSDEEATKAFKKLIKQCLVSIAARANFVIHLLAHPDKE